MPVHDWRKVEAGLFHYFHYKWVSAIDDALNERILPADYYSMVEQRTLGYEADQFTLKRADESGASSARAPEDSRHPIAVAEAPPQVEFVESADDWTYTTKRRTLVIRNKREDRIVALIEVISPGNKSGREPIEQFVDKAVTMLEHHRHLLIVDVLPPGPRDPHGLHPLIWTALLNREPQHLPGKPLSFTSYAAGPTVSAYVQSVDVGERLPDMPLFLSPDEYVVVPLESTYQRVIAHLPDELKNLLT